MNLKSIPIYLALMVAGFSFAMYLVKFGIYQPDNPNLVTKTEYDHVKQQRDDAISLNDNLIKEIIDSLSIQTLILDTDSGEKRVIKLKEGLDKLLFFVPSTATTKGKLTEKEKRTDFLIAHWHAYRRGSNGDAKSEDDLLETIKQISGINPNAQFLIYSSTFGNKSAVENLKKQIRGKSIGDLLDDRLSWIKFPYKADDHQTQKVINTVIEIGKQRFLNNIDRLKNADNKG